MKRTFHRLIIAAVVAFVPCAIANAQNTEGNGPDFKKGPRPMLSAEEMAQRETDAMNSELELTEKQYKKILKYYKNEIQKEREMMEANRPEGMPGGFPGGRPDFEGGRPPMGGQMPPQGGGFPVGGFPGGGPGMGGGRPPMGAPGMMPPSDEEMEKFYIGQDIKLKKILTAGQYEKWRSKHPVKQMPMPEPEWSK